ncbi:sugar transferase [Anaerophaga thermohalophila]|jgi:lipopolysaccharide/colanic/teichoic acid biosynthesis glycosyltransferase|uniref:sugar transferase n=1 Tax=Anaerophaga thermohalophila TaxID=177400 RepID=UPI0002E9BB90|nr:sugar transferase [Anaerophaga thermohalophila]
MLHFYHQATVASETTITLPPGIAEEQRTFRVRDRIDESIYRFLARFCNVEAEDSLVLSTSDSFNITIRGGQQFRSIINLQRLNEVRRLCEFLADTNHKLRDEGLFICCLETSKLRKQRLFRKYPPGIRKLYYFFDYLIKRVAPTIRATRWFYKLLTGDRNKVISFYEMVGRLIYCGFQMEYDEVIDGSHYMVARKVTRPPASRLKERYGLLLSLKRVGKEGRMIRVYKFRTMVAFSEYVQEHIYRKNKLGAKGKFRDDKRVTILGSIFRKLWIDELPMIINLLKGEMKLVGVRPLSPQYLALYDPDVVRLRLSVKPGLVPPFYADLPSTLEEIQASEIRYIERYKQAPFRTDVIYLFRALWNIVGCGARSK